MTGGTLPGTASKSGPPWPTRTHPNSLDEKFGGAAFCCAATGATGAAQMSPAKATKAPLAYRFPLVTNEDISAPPFRASFCSEVYAISGLCVRRRSRFTCRSRLPARLLAAVPRTRIFRGTIGLRLPLGARSLRPHAREPQHHRRALVEGRADAHGAAVQLGQRFRDGEAEARALMGLGQTGSPPARTGGRAFSAPASGCRRRCPRTPGRSRCRRRGCATRTRPPSGVNFTAFDSRLSAICLMARLSARSFMPGARSHDQRQLLGLRRGRRRRARHRRRPHRSRPPRSRA